MMKSQYNIKVEIVDGEYLATCEEYKFMSRFASTKEEAINGLLEDIKIGEEMIREQYIKNQLPGR